MGSSAKDSSDSTKTPASTAPAHRQAGNALGHAPSAATAVAPSRSAHAPDSSRPLTFPRGSTALPLDAGFLYIVVKRQDIQNHWLWGLYIHEGPARGTFISAVQRSASTWTPQQVSETTIAYDETVLTALCVAEVDEDIQPVLCTRLAQVAVPANRNYATGIVSEEAMTRSWVLRAIEALDNEGFVSLRLSSTISSIEEEAMALATDANILDARQVMTSKHFLI